MPESDHTSATKARIDLNSMPAVGAAVVFGIVAVAIFPVMPIYLGALVDHLGLTPSQGGYIAGAEVTGMAAGNALAFFWVRQVNWRKVATFAVFVLVAFNLLCIGTAGFAALLPLRFVIGLAEGTALALTYAMLGGSDNPDRNYGLFLVGSLSTGAVNVYLLSHLASEYGAMIFFIDLAAFSLVAGWFLKFVPDYGYQEAVGAGPEARGQTIDVGLPLIIIILVANLVYFIAQGGIWAYLERIGTGGGLTVKQAAGALSVSLFMGVLGALAASSLNIRWGRVVPLGLAIAAVIVSVLLLQWQLTFAVFLISACVWNFANNFGHPYLLGYLAAVDKSGRYVVVSGAMQTGGMGLGPALAASLISGTDYGSVLDFGLACFILTLLLFMPIMILVRGVENRDLRATRSNQDLVFRR